MTRAQLQIDDRTYEALRAKAFRERRSISAVVRDLLHESLGLTEAEVEPEPVHPKFTFIGSGYCEIPDISVNHDKYLAEDFL